MELYSRFMVSLAFGLIGIGLVLKVLIDQLFNDWDVFADLKAGLRSLFSHSGFSSSRTEDILMDVENDKPRELSTRHIDRRREQLKEMDLVEHRLNVPAKPFSMAAPASVASPVYDDWGSSPNP